MLRAYVAEFLSGLFIGISLVVVLVAIHGGG